MVSHAAHFKNCTTPENCWCEVKRYARVLGIAFLALTIEIIGGIFSGSLALLADAAHVFADNFAIVVSIIVAALVRSGTKEHTVRTKGFWINMILMAGVIGIIFYEATERLSLEHRVHGEMMLAVTIIGGLLNVWQIRELQGGEKNKTHRALSLHVAGDLAVSVGAAITGLLLLATNISLFDVVASYAIGVWLIYRTIQTSREVLGEKHHH